MANTKISDLPVANNTDTLEYAGIQNSTTVQIPPAASLAQTLRTLGYTPAPINSPTFTGDPKAPTPSTGDNDTSVATTAFVKAQNYVTALTAPVTSVFGRAGDVAAVSGDYNVAEVTGAAPLVSPTFTGIPAAPTAAVGTNTTQIATCAFVLANEIPKGTSFPGSPNVNDLFFRTDAAIKLLFYWSGTLWLTVDNYGLSGNPINTLAPYTIGGNIFRWPVRSDLASFFSGIKVATFVSATNNGSNFWTMTINKTNSAGVNTAFAGGSITTAADSPGTWVNHDLQLSEQVSSSAHETVTLSVAATGAPGSLNLSQQLVFRLIGV